MSLYRELAWLVHKHYTVMLKTKNVFLIDFCFSKLVMLQKEGSWPIWIRLPEQGICQGSETAIGKYTIWAGHLPGDLRLLKASILPEQGICQWSETALGKYTTWAWQICQGSETAIGKYTTWAGRLTWIWDCYSMYTTYLTTTPSICIAEACVSV